jgi:hypothetical protein
LLESSRRRSLTFGFKTGSNAWKLHSAAASLCYGSQKSRVAAMKDYNDAAPSRSISSSISSMRPTTQSFATRSTRSTKTSHCLDCATSISVTFWLRIWPCVTETRRIEGGVSCVASSSVLRTYLIFKRFCTCQQTGIGSAANNFCDTLQTAVK